MSKLIEQKYENEFQHKATEFVDKMVEQFEMRKRELEKQYKKSKERAEEADERAMEATQKADDALKRASLVEDQARHAIEKAQMMERRYLEMMSRENRSSEPVEVEKADDALKRASVVEEQARQAIEKAQMMEKRYLEMMSPENRNSERMEVKKVDDALERASVVEEQARQAIEKAQMMERRYLEMMSQGNRNSEQMDEETAGSVVPVNVPMDSTTIQMRNQTPDDNDDNGIDIYSMVVSEDNGNARGPLSKGKERDTGDDEWDDDEQWEQSAGPKVPSSYDPSSYEEEMTTGEKDSNGRWKIDELGPEPDVCLC
jgi:hypothetical protein